MDDLIVWRIEIKEKRYLFFLFSFWFNCEEWSRLWNCACRRGLKEERGRLWGGSWRSVRHIGSRSCNKKNYYPTCRSSSPGESQSKIQKGGGGEKWKKWRLGWIEKKPWGRDFVSCNCKCKGWVLKYFAWEIFYIGVKLKPKPKGNIFYFYFLKSTVPKMGLNCNSNLGRDFSRKVREISLGSQFLVVVELNNSFCNFSNVLVTKQKR